MSTFSIRQEKLAIGVIGLGYVGLPLLAAFAGKYEVVGFDVNKKRISELACGLDITGELDECELQRVTQLTLTSNPTDLRQCSIYIVTVPTPIDDSKRPDLSFLEMACETVGRQLVERNIVIFESTVYPGCTEEVCVPILEKFSGLKFNEGFFCGYSPERINPGDRGRRLRDIIKVTSGSTPEVSQFIDQLYGEVIVAGTHMASSIKVAEAAKVIENTQRDLNIALMNELSIIFDMLNIETIKVLEAAGTKWNFLNFRPGLVGGHCIGVDPYYLTHKAQSLGYVPEVILAGRQINEKMSSYVAQKLIKRLSQSGETSISKEVLIMGITFKENCPDIRNSKVVNLISTLNANGANVSCYDPWVTKEDAASIQNLTVVENLEDDKYDAVVIAVAHEIFAEMGIESLKACGKSGALYFDLKGMFDVNEVDFQL